MIYVVTIILITVLYVTELFLIVRHGKLLNYPLRRKLISDVSNIILFLIGLWLAYKLFAPKSIFVSLVIYVGFLLLVTYRNSVKKILVCTLKTIHHRIAFHGNDISSYNRKKTKQSQVDMTHNQSPYRECVIMVIVLYSKRINTIGIFLLSFLYIVSTSNTRNLFTAFSLNELLSSPLPELWILINNAGLVFAIYKFYFDWKAIKCEKSDNTRYLEVIKRLDRDEHAI